MLTETEVRVLGSRRPMLIAALVALSATVRNIAEIADWISLVHRPIVPITHPHRSVPLQYLVADLSGEIHAYETVRNGKVRLLGQEREGGYSDKGRWYTRRVVDPTVMLDELETRGWLPAIYFIFSRAGCERAMETVLAEGIPGGFSTLYAELGNLELLERHGMEAEVIGRHGGRAGRRTRPLPPGVRRAGPGRPGVRLAVDGRYSDDLHLDQPDDLRHRGEPASLLSDEGSLALERAAVARARRLRRRDHALDQRRRRDSVPAAASVIGGLPEIHYVRSDILRESVYPTRCSCSERMSA